MQQQVIDELIKPANNDIKLGSDRMHLALDKLGKPQDKYPVIHIAGTNGKGSTAAFIELGLIHAGFKVGKYTSPHIHKINETICLDGNSISDNDLEETFFAVKNLIQNIELSPFELLTTIMFYYFANQKIDYLILEAGMGGLEDATNVVNADFSIITNISLEHTQFLGNSLNDIARHKAGIIKNGQVIIADNTPELITAVKAKVPTYTNVLDKYLATTKLDHINFKTQVNLTNGEGYTLNVLGKFQANNFLCAYAVLTSLKVSHVSIAYAATHMQWKGRIERIATKPDIILDAAHNLAGAKVLYETLAEYCQPQDTVIIVSILADKAIPQMLSYFSQLASTAIFTTITNTMRALSATQLAEISRSNFLRYYTIDNPHEALIFANTLNKKTILIAGSIYLLSYYE